jgi:hypothetical protein
LFWEENKKPLPIQFQLKIRVSQKSPSIKDSQKRPAKTGLIWHLGYVF